MQHTRVTGTTFMGDANARSTNKPGAQPIHPILVPFPIACFAGAFVTDLVYWQTAAVTWGTFSDVRACHSCEVEMDTSIKETPMALDDACRFKPNSTS